MRVQLSLRNSDLLWLGIVLFCILTIAFLLPIPPNDYWWYLRLGEDIIDLRAVPGADTYSSTQFGQPITYQSWLSAVLFYLLNRLGGSLLTVLIRGIIIATFFFLIWYTCRLAGSGARLASLVTLVAALASSNNWAVRPQLFSLVIFALFLSFLWKWRKGKTRWIWMLPILMLLWVNLHGAFILGFLLVIAALIGGEGNRRELFVILILMGVISLINPHGWRVWQYVFSLLSDPASQQLGTEWHPLNIRAWQGLIFYAWLLFFPFLASYSKNNLAWMDWLLFFGFGWMALNGLRYVIWFVTILAVMSTSLLEPLVGNYLDTKKIPGRPAINGIVFSLLLLLPVVFLPGIRNQWWKDYPPILTDNTPVDAVDWLKDHPELPGPLWSDLAFSSYIIYALPERSVWIDPRFELYPISHWNRYIRVSTASPDWSIIMDEEGIAMVLVDIHEQEQLIDVLSKNENWCLHYNDEISKIFTRISNAGDC